MRVAADSTIEATSRLEASSAEPDNIVGESSADAPKIFNESSADTDQINDGDASGTSEGKSRVVNGGVRDGRSFIDFPEEAHVDAWKMRVGSRSEFEETGKGGHDEGNDDEEESDSRQHDGRAGGRKRENNFRG